MYVSTELFQLHSAMVAGESVRLTDIYESSIDAGVNLAGLYSGISNKQWNGRGKSVTDKDETYICRYWVHNNFR
jgi:hypothetical protein